ncbi:MAG: YicC family protein [Clostridia bacterium]|nr:YicC family protein [Clostridia bacterium]MBQ7789502.1 YicC family protein [Clostridia bacterium]
MFRSMTAFGRSRQTVNGKDIVAEIKSVNNRYYDCTVKITKLYSFLEDKIKQYLQSKGISRGKVEVYVSIDLLEQDGVEINLDTAYAKSYIDALYKLRDTFDLKDDITVSRVAANKDIFSVKKPEDDIEKDWADIKVVLDSALETFIERRESEGENLYKNIVEKINNIKNYLKVIEANSESDIKGYASKLEERILKFLSDNSVQIDEQRILTEVAIFADKVAIDEELVRLNSHFDAFEDIVKASEPAGRKLDFLLQEMNRETNTIGSKASNSDTAHLVVNIKNELEKIREQIQNIE